jgi:oligopeptide/dipeptide ABC transporter ATP-binding protein
MTFEPGTRSTAASASDASAPQGPPLLAVDRLSASYRTEHESIDAVREVSLEVRPGETLALVGESAAGKSTIGHAILGLLPGNAEVRADALHFRGRSLLDLPREELRQIRGDEIAMIFQDALSSLTPTLRVRDQLSELFLAHREIDKDEAEGLALEALSRLLPDAERVFDLYPFQLSGGMAQRVMITLAIALEPSLIIADEPTASLDPSVRMETLQILEQLRDQRGVGILLITHDFGVVARLADRVAVMYAGQVVETADVRTIFKAPRHPYSFGLLQSLPGAHQQGRLQPLRGQPPDLSDLPPQCPFLPRCAKAVSKCRLEDAPTLEPVGDEPGHLAACYNPMAIPIQD